MKESECCQKNRFESISNGFTVRTLDKCSFQFCHRSICAEEKPHLPHQEIRQKPSANLRPPKLRCVLHHPTLCCVMSHLNSAYTLMSAASRRWSYTRNGGKRKMCEVIRNNLHKTFTVVKVCEASCTKCCTTKGSR